MMAASSPQPTALPNLPPITQDKHAANAGDGPKHVTLIAAARVIQPQRVVETHAGGGVYLVSPTSFAVVLAGTSKSLLSAAQSALASKVSAPIGSTATLYGGSAAIVLTCSTANYVGIESEEPAYDRLCVVMKHLADANRSQAIKGSYERWLRKIWTNGPNDLLVTDPFGVKDVHQVWQRTNAKHFLGWWPRTVKRPVAQVAFGQCLHAWDHEVAQIPAAERISWRWQSGAEEFELILRSTAQNVRNVLPYLTAEHQLLQQTMGGVYSSSNGPQ